MLWYYIKFTMSVPFILLNWLWKVVWYGFFGLLVTCAVVVVLWFMLVLAQSLFHTESLLSLANIGYGIGVFYVASFLMYKLGGDGSTYSYREARYQHAVRSGQIEPTYVTPIDMNRR